MNQRLKEILERDYQYAIDGQVVDAAEAATVRDSGDMPTYFDLSLYLQLADLCWALEKWDDAKRWYRHNANIFRERRAWRSEHISPESQTEDILDWEAVTFVKAGELEMGRASLQRAIEYFQRQPDSELRLTELGLHAAQVGLADLANNAAKIVTARQQLGNTDKKAQQAREHLHYEPAQISLMLGKSEQFEIEIKKFAEAAQLVQGRPGFAFPEPLQGALVKAADGLSAIAALHSGSIEPDNGQRKARESLEESMLSFYTFNGQIDWNLYFMRLNTRFADELAARQPLNPNPFADTP